MKTIKNATFIRGVFCRKDLLNHLLQNIFFIIFIPLLISLYSCGGGLPSGDERSAVYAPVDMGSYVVNYPAGDKWKMNIERATSKVFFTRDKSSTSSDIFGVLTGAGSDGYTYITVHENKIVIDTSNIRETEASKDFMENEVKLMRKDVKKELYKIRNIIYTDTVVNGKKFYCMDYEINEFKNSSGHYFYADCKLALYFPSDFTESRRFYVFLINDFSNSITIGKDSGQLYSVMASFKLKGEAL